MGIINYTHPRYIAFGFDMFAQEHLRLEIHQPRWRLQLRSDNKYKLCDTHFFFFRRSSLGFANNLDETF